MWKWIEKEWSDVRPNLKYDIYRGIVIASAGGVVTFAVLFMKTIRRIPEPLFYGVLFVVTCLCFVFLANHLTRHTGGRSIEQIGRDHERALSVSPTAKDEAEFADRVGRMPADEYTRLYNGDAQFRAKVDAIPHNKYKILVQYPSEPFRYVDTLEKRAFDVAKEVCALLKAHGPEPTLEEGKRYCREHNKDIMDWHWERIKPWRERIAAGWRAKVEPNVRQVRDELAEQGLTDNELDTAIGVRILTEEHFKTIARRLRFLAAHLEC